MSRLFKFFALPSSDRRIFVLAAIWMIMIRAALWVAPFQLLRRWLARASERGQSARITKSQIVWAVKAASRYVPLASCLTQALTAQLLLRQNGYDAVLRIGVALRSRRKLQAHAWVECEGSVVIGESEKGHFAVLSHLNQAFEAIELF